MNNRSWAALGFVSLVAPASVMVSTVLFLGPQTSIRVIPPIYLLSFVPLIAYPYLVKTSGNIRPESHIAFSTGAWRGIVGLALLSSALVPTLRATSSESLETDISLLLILVGSLFLPRLSALASYARVFGPEMEAGRFLGANALLNQEGVVWLAFVLPSGNKAALRKSLVFWMALIPLVSFYARGWFLLASLGSAYAPILGLVVFIAILSSAMLTLRRLVTSSDRRKLYTFTSDKPPVPSGRTGVAGDIVGFFLVALVAVGVWL